MFDFYLYFTLFKVKIVRRSAIRVANIKVLVSLTLLVKTFLFYFHLSQHQSVTFF